VDLLAENEGEVWSRIMDYREATDQREVRREVRREVMNQRDSHGPER
jgi:hypothetical protein